MRLSREVRIGELVATLVAISAMATGYIELRLRPVDQQIAALKRQANVAEHQAERREALQEAQLATFKRELRDDLGRVESKLDRLLESRGVR